MQRHGLASSSWLWGHKFHLAARWSDKFAVAATTNWYFYLIRRIDEKNWPNSRTMVAVSQWFRIVLL